LGALYLSTSLIFDLISVLVFAGMYRPTGLKRLASFAELASAAVYGVIAVVAVVSFMSAPG
jgi:hypothetical protein